MRMPQRLSCSQTFLIHLDFSQNDGWINWTNSDKGDIFVIVTNLQIVQTWIKLDQMTLNRKETSFVIIKQYFTINNLYFHTN